ncbi:MAG: outer membrane lipoprotein-sorting protein, partial [Deltaproteobacteria bacterium]|nr:outer membrane lipoprotein-sorting protein [Deltaproteobacteria bacterium]
MKLILLALLLFSTTIKSAPPETKAAPVFTDIRALEVIKILDGRQRNTGDYKALCFVKETEKGKEPKVFQVVVYRRDNDDKFAMLFTKPKEEAGKGYLKIDKNLWLFDPNTGKWERRTERERIGGTNSRRADFDESQLAEKFNATAEGTDKLGSYSVYKIKLIAKKDVDVPY